MARPRHAAARGDAARGDDAATERLLRTVAFREQGESDEMAAALLAGVGQGLAQRKLKLANFLPQLGSSDSQRVASS